MSRNLDKAINCVSGSQYSFCHFIVENEVGKTGSHQCGFLVPHNVWPMFFDSPGMKGENKDKTIKIDWQDDFSTESRVVYYGVGTRNEYRITRFGRNFPYLQKERAGDLLILAKETDGYYKGFVLSADEDIDSFLAFFEISPLNMGQLIGSSKLSSKFGIADGIDKIISINTGFPSTKEMSRLSQELYNKVNRNNLTQILRDPDKSLLGWINTEFSLFRAFENKEFAAHCLFNIKDCQELIDYANSLTNRRKSRAGKSLENHLATIFDFAKLKYEAQVITEGKKKPDFIFPDGASYHNLLFPTDGLTFLGAKTTCKDRWRQVLNEADRIPHKYLFTLQQGISANQLKEMKTENLSLVVPRQNITTFDPEYRDNIISLKQFVEQVKEKQQLYY